MSFSVRALMAMIAWTPFYIIPAIGCFYAVRRISKKIYPFIFTDWILLGWPWLVWSLSLFVSPQTKSLSNFAEAYALLLVSSIGYWVRLTLSARSFNAAVVGWWVIAAVSLIAIALAIFTPALPE